MKPIDEQRLIVMNAMNSLEDIVDKMMLPYIEIAEELTDIIYDFKSKNITMKKEISRNGRNLPDDTKAQQYLDKTRESFQTFMDENDATLRIGSEFNQGVVDKKLAHVFNDWKESPNYKKLALKLKTGDEIWNEFRETVKRVAFGQPTEAELEDLELMRDEIADKYIWDYEEKMKFVETSNELLLSICIKHGHLNIETSSPTKGNHRTNTVDTHIMNTRVRKHAKQLDRMMERITITNPHNDNRHKKNNMDANNQTRHAPKDELADTTQDASIPNASGHAPMRSAGTHTGPVHDKTDTAETKAKAKHECKNKEQTRVRWAGTRTSSSNE